MTQDKKTIILAAGGTGGHMFPAEALGRALMQRGYNIVLVTDVRGAKFETFDGDVQQDVIFAATFKPGVWSKIKALFSICLGVFQSFKLVKKYNPVCVVGFGGYPSLPCVLAAQIMGRKTILHNMDATLGKANKILSYRARGIAAGHPIADVTNPKLRQKIQVTGNPVREEFLDLRDAPYVPPSENEPFHVFVMGGSLGARIFSDVVPPALDKLPDEMERRVRVIQQCRPEDVSAVRNWYDQVDIEAEVTAFVDNVAECLSWCHLFIGRSGASTVTEVTLMGRPAIFVPANFHADNQQKKNADSVADSGGAWVMLQNAFTPEAVSARVEQLIAHTDMLVEAAAACKSCGRPNATEKLTDFVDGLIHDTIRLND